MMRYFGIMVRTVVAVLIGLIIVGQAALPSDEFELIDATHVQRFAMDPFENSKGQNPIFYNDLSGILKRFGKPLETAESRFPDRTSDATLTSHWLQYDGLKFVVTESEDKRHSWPDTITISGNTYPLKFGIKIGTAYADFLELLQIEPPSYRARGSRMNVYADVGGYWPEYRDQSGQPKYVYGFLTASFYFDDEDKIEKILLWMSSH